MRLAYPALNIARTSKPLTAAWIIGGLKRQLRCHTWQGLLLAGVCTGIVNPAFAASYFVRGSCANNGDGAADTCAATAGASGAWKTLTSAASAPLNAGDVVRIHAGTYRERFWPQFGGAPGNPITFETYGDGDVTIDGSSASIPAFTGIFYSPNSGSTGFVRNVNHLTLRGKPGSLLHITGSGSTGIVIYAGNDRANGNNFTFQHVRVHDIGNGGLIEGSNFKILDSQFYNNGYAGLWVFAPAHNFEIRRSKFYNNDRDGGNTDGLNIQDASFGLLEDLETYGQYDGLDIGSQSSSPGASFIIVRRVRSYSNSNTNFPNSTTVSGPICFQYTEQWDNYNWGSSVSYENSTNVEYWNSVFDDVLTGVNIQAPRSGAQFVARNNIFRVHQAANAANPGTALSGAPGARFDADYNRVIVGNYGGDVSVGGHSSTGPVQFVNQAGRDYRLTSANAGVIDGGTFFTSTTASGSNTVNVPTTKDPRRYFWPGDTIQIQGFGTRVVASLSSTAITLTQSATFSANAGVHLTWSGSAPDIGANEFSGTSTAAPLRAPSNLRVVQP